jgi:hypothetical protein
MEMEPKKMCGICGRMYKPIPLKTKGIDEWAIGYDTSHIRIRLRDDPDKTALYDWDTCPNCARNVIWHIKTMKRTRRNRCDFCEHDLGPKHPDYRKGCQGCHNYCNFQLKKRMSVAQNLFWKYFNGED